MTFILLFELYLRYERYYMDIRVSTIWIIKAKLDYNLFVDRIWIYSIHGYMVEWISNMFHVEETINEIDENINCTLNNY